jgi:hypothetical protein
MGNKQGYECRLNYRHVSILQFNIYTWQKLVHVVLILCPWNTALHEKMIAAHQVNVLFAVHIAGRSIIVFTKSILWTVS